MGRNRIACLLLLTIVVRSSVLSFIVPCRHSNWTVVANRQKRPSSLSQNNNEQRLVANNRQRTMSDMTASVQSEDTTVAASTERSDTTRFSEEEPSLQIEFEAVRPRAQTVDGRLLCAAQCAYEIDVSKPYFRAAAYKAGTTAKRVSRGVNSVLIGRTYDGITIAFRGTKTASPIDWLQNAALFLSMADEESLTGGKIKGRIHMGFYRAVRSLWKPLKSILKDMLDSIPEERDRKVYITGHSKGGAMASIAAILMKKDIDMPDPEHVCTFASVKFANSEFRDFYNKEVSQTTYEAYLDLIPFLPPSSSTMEIMDDDMTDMVDGILWSETTKSRKTKYIWDFQAVGTRRYIDENGMIFPVTKELDEERIAAIESATFLSVKKFRSTHCLSCPNESCAGLYFRGVAKEVCDTCQTDHCEEEKDALTIPNSSSEMA